MVAVMRRTSTFVVVSDPNSLTSRSWIALRSFTCIGKGNSPISSKKRVPPLALWKRPRLEAMDPVKAPRVCPNSSLSKRPSGIAPQFTAMKGPLARLLLQ